MKLLRVGGLVALVLGVVVVLYLSLRQMGGATPASSASAGATSGRGELGEPPPEAVRSSPKAAKQYVERQNCVANCASERRTCEATADDDGAAQRCRDRATACEAECPQP
jgi:hypothetical protein